MSAYRARVVRSINALYAIKVMKATGFSYRQSVRLVSTFRKSVRRVWNRSLEEFTIVDAAAQGSLF